MGKYLDLEGLEYLCGKIKTDLDGKQNQLAGQPGQLVGFCGEGISALNITAGNNIKLAQSDSELEIGVNMDNGVVSGDVALLDGLIKQGTYTWLDKDGSMGTAGGLWNVVVSRSDYGVVHPSVTQMLCGTYGAKTKGRILSRAFYYANTPNWTPWRELAGSDQIASPNLLDNWYFPNPINQREQTKYLSTGYTIDRWYSENLSVTLGADGLTLKGGGPKAAFIQRWEIERIKGLVGKTLTLSVLTTSGLSYCVFQIAQHENGSYQSIVLTHMVSYDLEGCEPQLDYNNGEYQIIRITPKLNESTTLVAAKLEHGSVQTLAHQEANGNWVFNDSPSDSTQELEKCQRYQIFGPLYGRKVWSFSKIACAYFIPTPVSLRTNPNLVGSLYYRREGLTENTLYPYNMGAVAVHNGLYLYLSNNANFDMSDINLIYLPAHNGIDANL